MKHLYYTFLGILLYTAPHIAAAQENTRLTNPLGTSDPRVIISRLLEGFLGLVGAIALLMFIYGGILFLTAAGSPGPVDKAKKVIVFSILGIIVIAAAYVATQTVFEAVLVNNTSGPAPGL